MPIWNIDRVPVTIIHGVNDNRCPVEVSEWLYSVIPETNPGKYMIIEGTGHYEYSLRTDNAFVTHMSDIISNGHLAG